MPDLRWITAVLHTPAATWEPALRFWPAATGWRASTEDDDLVVLLPGDGDPTLALRLTDGVARVTLDLHVSDPAGMAERAASLGVGPGLVSPGGLAFRVVDGPPRRRPAPTRWPVGASLADQVAIDAPDAAWAHEVAFWSALTGWPTTTSSAPQFAPLHRPDGIPLRLMVHRLQAAPTPVVGAHLDIACTDRAAETARHTALGSVVEAVRGYWTVLVAPDGRRYCLTDRDPFTGRLPGA